MTTLTIPNVDPGLHERLRTRAVHNGRSVEAELLAILNDALAGGHHSQNSLGDAIRRRFAPFVDVDLQTSSRQPPAFES